MIFRPILGAKASDIREIRLPCFASLKFDGWRAIWHHREFFSRKLITVPNRNLQAIFATLELPTGLDGELIYGDPAAPNCFNATDRLLKRAGAAAAGIRFFAFDNAAIDAPFWRRHESVHDISPHVVRLDHRLISDYDELERFEAEAVGNGYEGIVTRAPEGRYKQGRSTMNEQYLVKVKRFDYYEGRITGFEELLRNANPAVRDNTGYAKRSSHADGKVPAGVLGAVLVDWRGQTLRIGTGFSGEDRAYIWGHRSDFLDKTCRFKALRTGAKPVEDGGTGLRPPLVWKGLRSDI